MEEFYQIFLPVFIAAFMLQTFVIRSFVQWKRTGVNPMVFGKADNAHDFAGRAYKVVAVVTWVPIVLFVFVEGCYKYLLPIWYLDNIEYLKIAGAVLMLLSFVWIIVAQFQMSDSWRIGIDYQEKTELVTKGIFSISRNPVFLGVLLTYVGILMVIPNALTFVLVVLTYVLLQIQIRLEEEYLKAKQGDEYKNYLGKVRRWI